MSAAGDALCILLVDDDRFMIDMLPRRLHKAISGERRVRILTATSPEQAVSLAGSCRGELLVVICDFNLRAAEDGIDVLRAIEQQAPRSVRILYSGHAASEVGPRIADAPIHAFVEKTFRLDDMLAQLREAILHGERTIRGG